VRRSALAALVLLSGCTLWDQTTFQPSPEAEPPAPPGPPPPGPRVDPRDPLVVIEYVTPDPLYRDPLRYAVRAAESRGRSVQYDVIAVVASVDGAQAGQQRALGVMRSIMQDRVPASRVHLGLRIDPSIQAPRVLVYVR